MGDYVDRGILISTQDIIVFRPLLYSLHSKLDIKIELPYLEEIISPDRLHKFMGFMINAVGNMATRMFGNA
jgi:hypothetical protein